MLRLLVIFVCIQSSVFGQNIQFPFDLSQFTNVFGNFPVFPNQMTMNNNNNQNNGVSVDDRGSFGEIVKPDVSAPTLRPPTADSERCNCVPYHSCTDNKRSVDFNSNNKIEIQYLDGTCEHYLDVCCGAGDGASQPAPNPAPTPQPAVVPQPQPAPAPAPAPAPQPTTAPQTEPIALPGCGVRNEGGIDFTITDVDPKFAGFGEFPWTVALIDVNTGRCDCAGSLILPQVVLTAGHCASAARARSLKVRAGEWDTQTEKERLPYQERRVAEVLPHPMFNDKTLSYDLALIRLDSPFNLDRHINVVCLPPQNYQAVSKNCFATGWGKDQFGKAGVYSVMLKKVPLPMVPHATCQNKLRTTRLSQKFNLHSSFVCAGGVPGTDTCEGDGGAPLHCPAQNNPKKFVQTGIVAWGIGCNTDIPAVYANVASMRNWIDETLQARGFDITPYSSY
ncbi:phenoloxidase-activating factor 2-like isoform X2 [Culicoides brevitarsis]